MTTASPAAGTAGGAGTGGRGRAAGRPKRERFAVLWRRLPFTTTVVLAILVAGVASRTLWQAAEHQPSFAYYAYGLPSLEHGRWWTLATGPFFAPRPLFYLPMAGTFALLTGFAEWQLGTRRTILVTVGGQLAAATAAIQFLVLCRHSGWMVGRAHRDHTRRRLLRRHARGHRRGQRDAARAVAAAAARRVVRVRGRGDRVRRHAR